MTETSMTNHKSAHNNKMLLIGGGVVLALIIMIGGIFAYSKMHGKADITATQTAAKKKVVAPTNIIPVADRPYVVIDPTDVHNISVQVNEIKKQATSLDYELEYQTDSSLEGAQDTLDVSKLPAKKTALLGTCSAGGACRYHTGVVGGTLMLKLSGGSENYTLKQEWNYIVNTAKDGKFSSKDAKFQVDSKDMKDQSIVIIYNSPGFPSTLPGTLISDPYVMSGINPLKGKANLTMRATEAAPMAEIVGWDGTKWNEFKSTVTDKTVTATVDLMQLYAVIKK